MAINIIVIASFEVFIQSVLAWNINTCIICKTNYTWSITDSLCPGAVNEYSNVTWESDPYVKEGDVIILGTPTSPLIWYSPYPEKKGLKLNLIYVCTCSTRIIITHFEISKSFQNWVK